MDSIKDKTGSNRNYDNYNNQGVNSNKEKEAPQAKGETKTQEDSSPALDQKDTYTPSRQLLQERSDAPKAAPSDETPGNRAQNQPSIWDIADQNFQKWDKDGDQYLTNDEINEATKQRDLSPDEGAALAALRGRQNYVEEYHDDEIGDDNDGFTTNDLSDIKASGDDYAKRVEEHFKIEQELRNESPEERQQALANRDNPANLTDKIGTRDYYIERYKDFVRRNPDSTPPDYYINYGLKYFDRFQALKPSLGSAGRTWVDRTAVLLQEKMNRLAVDDPAKFAELERDPEKFKEFAYATHPDAYLEAGLQNVPISERITIARTPDGDDLATRAGISQAIETAAKVTSQDVDNAKQAVKDEIREKATEAVGWGLRQVRDAAVELFQDAAKNAIDRIRRSWLPQY